MNTLTNRATRKYYRQAKHEMPLCYSSKKEYLSDLQDMLNNVLLEYPDISYLELTNLLGSPEQQTKSYAELLSAEELYKNIHTAKKLHRIILIVTVILALFICGSAVAITNKYIKSQYSVVIEQPSITQN